MNKDVMKGKWHQIKGQIKQQWAKLTDDDVRRIEGSLEEGAGRLQERYGHTREQAEREWKEFCTRCASEPARETKQGGE